MYIKKKKIIIALSGGIDSAVAAALLKKKGYQVSGVFMNLIPKKKEFSEARKNFQKAEKNARKIAQVLKIPFFVLDLSTEFEKQVINSFLNEFKKGRTPNPCVVCNQKIRFDIFLKKMRKKGADFVATGHYARLRRKVKSQKHALESHRGSKVKSINQKSKITYRLFQAKDKEKDQSYFLYNLNQKHLKRILFPLGDLTKKEVRKLAKKFNLSVFERPESQEICFVKDLNVNDFLRRYLKLEEGLIINEYGQEIGKHQGLFLYTIGQRKTIGIGGTGPYYVVGKDFKKNNLIVTNNFRSPFLYRKSLIAKKVNWISGSDPTFPIRIKARVRYRQEAVSAEIRKIRRNIPYRPACSADRRRATYEVVFFKSQRAIAPGQSVVFYRRGEILGGGIIEN